VVTTEAPAPPRPRLRWWKEAILLVVFYSVYSSVRNQFGSAKVDVANGQLPVHAFNNAQRVIGFEKAVGLYHELTIQQWFVPPANELGELWIRFWNVYYGSFHFVVTVAAFIWLFAKAPERFTRWRTALGITTALAILGFALFPLMPPRLLDKPATEWGGQEIAEQRGIPPAGFVDTLADYGGLWSFDSGGMTKLSNQYASMPSLHIGWATWCALAMWPLVRRRWARALLVLYPIATLFCIVVTANHYWLDGLIGLCALGIGVVTGTWFDNWNKARVARRSSGAPTESAPAAHEG
jgi:hypothetical protein